MYLGANLQNFLELQRNIVFFNNILIMRCTLSIEYTSYLICNQVAFTSLDSESDLDSS